MNKAAKRDYGAVPCRFCRKGEMNPYKTFFTNRWYYECDTCGLVTPDRRTKQAAWEYVRNTPVMEDLRRLLQEARNLVVVQPCDHSVGVCFCQERDWYTRCTALLGRVAGGSLPPHTSDSDGGEE